jgi:hypothetical protein
VVLAALGGGEEWAVLWLAVEVVVLLVVGLTTLGGDEE